MPELAPTNSPTTAPTTASVTDTLRPAKIAGKACGRLTKWKVWSQDAFIERARSRMSWSTDLKPRTPATTTGKKPSKKAEITSGAMPNPKHTTHNGTTATFGIDCEKTRRG